jgi:hypothetical protein
VQTYHPQTVLSLQRCILQFGVGPLWLALMNGGGVRASIQAPAGQPYPYNISQNDIFTVLPVSSAPAGVSVHLGMGPAPRRMCIM